MPLHAEHEAPARESHGFDQSVGGRRLNLEARPEPVDRLLVQRIDHDLLGACKPREQAAWLQTNAMVFRRVADGSRQRCRWRAMVELARQLVHVLMQRAAAGDVQLLHATA